MKSEIIKELEGYNIIIEEIEHSRKHGHDFIMDRGEVTHGYAFT